MTACFASPCPRNRGARQVLRVSLCVSIAALLLLPGLLFARGGGGGRGGMGGNGGWMNEAWQKYQKDQQEQKRKADAKKVAERVTKLLEEGYMDLRAGDADAALDAFSDVLDLKSDSGDAKLGVGLAHALQEKWTLAAGQFETASRDKAQERLAIYNQAVVYVRMNQKPRAIAVLHKYLAAHVDLVDEMVLNAQASLIIPMDDAQRKTIGLIPNVLRVMDQQDKVLAERKYTGQERWGITWVPTGLVARFRKAGGTPPYMVTLPFVLPDESAMPDKTGKTPDNDLLPEVAALLAQKWIAWIDPNLARQMSSGAVASSGASGGATPTTRPTVVATGATRPALPTTTEVAMGGQNGPSTTQPTTQPAAPGPAVATIRGAAFAVTPELLITTQRLIANASSITLTDVDGITSEAEVAATDPITGLAMLKVPGGKFHAMPLADACRSGPVGVACFSRAVLFNPELSILRGDLAGAGGGKFTLRMATHPRSPGCPVIDEKGNVLALVSASREDPMEKLPVIPIDAIRRFCSGRVPPTAVGSPDPQDCVVQVTVLRHQTGK